MKNRIVALILSVLCLASLFAGCAKKAPAPEANDPQSNQNLNITQEQNMIDPEHSQQQEAPGRIDATDSPDTLEEAEAQSPHVRVTKEEEVARDFIEALLTKNYEKAISLFECSVDGGSDFVFPADVEWALPRSDYKDLSYFDPETAEYTTSLRANDTVDVTVKDAAGENQTFAVRTKIPDGGDGTPLVNGEGQFYCRNYTIRIGGGTTKLEVEGNEVPASLKKRGTGKYALTDDYLFPVIGLKAKSMRIVCDNFDETKEITPSGYNDIENDEGSRWGAALTDEQVESLLRGIIDHWNNAYTASEAEGSTATDLSKYVASDAAPEISTNLYDLLTSLSKSSNKKDCKVTQALVASGTPFWYSDHVVGVNVNYELTWKQKYGSSWDNESMRRKTGCIMAYEEGEWKVYLIFDNAFYNYTNTVQKDW